MTPKGFKKKSSRSESPDNAVGEKKARPTKPRLFTPLETKLFLPPRDTTWVSRFRLDEKLSEGFGRKLSLVSAPAGFGKTTVVVDWIHRKNIPAAWFSVDDRDNDPLHFLIYIILAIQSLRKDIGGDALKMLRSAEPPPTESILISLINDVLLLPTDFSLIIDDYHAIDTGEVHDLIVFLLENLPDQMHVVIVTRSDPPLPLMARFRSQNQLTELRAADLSFTADEIDDLFNETLKYKLSTVDIEMLETRTEGWIAGLRLAALSLQGREDRSSFIQTFKGDNRYIADYLIEEVLNRQPETVQNFLLQTSILDRLSGSLCDAVTSQKNSQQIIGNLEMANLFVIPLDDERRWYRYHHLFAELLEQRLRSTQIEILPDLHRRASRWFTENGYKNEAVEQAFLAEDFSLAVSLIEELAEVVWDRARDSQLLRWLKKLPGELLQVNPKLCIFYARELFKSGFLDEAEKKLQTAEQLLISGADGDLAEKGLLGRIAVIRAYIAIRTGAADTVIDFSKLALELLPENDLNWRGVAATTLGLGYGWNKLVDSQEALSEAMEICRVAGNIYYEIFAGSLLGSVLMRRGKIKESYDLCRKLLRLAIDNGIEQTGITGSLYLNLGGISSEWNDIDEGIRLIERGIKMSQIGRDPVVLASCYLSLQRSFIYRMDFAGALALIDKMNEIDSDYTLPIWITNTISALNVFCLLSSGDLNAAVQWVKDRGLRIDGKLDHLREVEYLAMAHILVAQGNLDEAEHLLQRLIKKAIADDQNYLLIEMRLWRSVALKLKGDPTSAMTELKSALSIGEPGGILMMFANKGKPVVDMLEEIVSVGERNHDAAKEGFSLAYVKKIIIAFKSVMPPKMDALMDPLSERELEVLHLIAAGLSNRDIGEKLFISLNTVKTHTRNINSKLDATSRTSAVARAKELNLL